VCVCVCLCVYTHMYSVNGEASTTEKREGGRGGGEGGGEGRGGVIQLGMGLVAARWIWERGREEFVEAVWIERGRELMLKRFIDARVANVLRICC
jgi:hypothetical protein